MVQWGKESTCNAGDTRDTGLIPGSGRSPGEGHWRPTAAFLPGESHGHEEPAVYRVAELDMTEVTEHTGTHSDHCGENQHHYKSSLS